MSRIIQMPGKPIFKIHITVDDKGQAVYETETHTPLGPVIKNQMHPAVLAKIFASCGAVAAEHCLQMFSKGKAPLIVPAGVQTEIGNTYIEGEEE